MLVDFGYINQDEKEQFANKSLEYLIEIPEKLESKSVGSTASTQKMNLIKTHYIRNLLSIAVFFSFNLHYPFRLYFCFIVVISVCVAACVRPLDRPKPLRLAAAE